MSIIRTPTRAEGGITAEEKVALDKHAALWIERAMRTDPIEPEKIIPAIEGIYAAAGLKKPRVVITPSPLVMAFAYGASAAILYSRKRATTAATRDATSAATYAATDAATRAATAATYAATDAATRDATYAATRDATRAATRDATAATTAATRAATRDATSAATDAATRAATDAATRDATYAATRAATSAATRAAADAAAVATDAATRAATSAATRAAADAAAVATDAATSAATDAATRDATRAATRDATSAATDAATRAATDAAADAAAVAEKGAAAACQEMAGDLGLSCARTWWRAHQGGNMWASYDCYLSAMRDVIGLRLPQHDAYSHWEQAAIHGGFRVMHEEFCIVSDFPEIIRVDDQHRPHCETGPSHRWRDGWALYHWHGVRVPDHWVEDREHLTAADVFKETNAEVRRAGCEILGWDRVLSGIDAKLIDDDGDPFIGVLYRGQIPGAVECGFLKVQCGTGRTFVIPVSPECNSAIEAQAWIAGKPVAKWSQPEVRG
jgi:hypothetical protein